MKTLLMVTILSAYGCTFQGNKNIKITKTNVGQHIHEKKNDLKKDSINSEFNFTLNCEQYTYDVKNRIIIVYLDNKIINEFHTEKIFYDRDSLNLIFTLKNEKKLVFLNLCEGKSTIDFMLEEDETLMNAVKLKNERYFVVIKSMDSDETIYEIEIDLERLELVEGKLSNFNYEQLEIL